MIWYWLIYILVSFFLWIIICNSKYLIFSLWDLFAVTSVLCPTNGSDDSRFTTELSIIDQRRMKTTKIIRKERNLRALRIPFFNLIWIRTISICQLMTKTGQKKKAHKEANRKKCKQRQIGKNSAKLRKNRKCPEKWMSK